MLRFLFLLQAFSVALPRWLFLAVLVYAPWAYGCTRWWAKTLLVQVLFTTIALWLCSLCLRRRWPRAALAAGVIGLCILGLGWLSVFNSLATYDELEQVFSPRRQTFLGWPGSWDAAFSLRAMLVVTALTGAFFMSMDLAANRVWSRRLFLTLALNGGLLLLFGLVQRATGASDIFWETSPAKSTFFATYFYHANAGAFINLTLPLVAGQTVLAFQGSNRHFARAFWSFLLLVSVTAVFVNTSRASTLIGVLIIATIGVGVASIAMGQLRRSLSTQLVASIGVVLACAIILMLGFGIGESVVRWRQTLSSLFASESAAPWEGRLEIYRTCWLSLSAAGWFGFGPGTFAIVFPYLQQAHRSDLNGILRYAHQDFLQTALEWGIIGFLLWAVLFGGGFVRAVLYLQSKPRALAGEHGIWVALCGLSLLGVLIHSLVDFPLQIASLQLIAAVLLGQLWAASSTKDPRSKRGRTLSIRSARQRSDRKLTTQFAYENASSRLPWRALDHRMLDVEHRGQRQGESSNRTDIESRRDGRRGNGGF